MIARTQTFDALQAQIVGMTTVEESTKVRDAMLKFKEYASGQEYEAIKKALSRRLNELAETEEQRLASVSDDLIMQNGERYHLDEWLTISGYAKKYGVSTHVVTNAIRRGTIPASCVIELTRINNIRMVKDQPYK